MSEREQLLLQRIDRLRAERDRLRGLAQARAKSAERYRRRAEELEASRDMWKLRCKQSEANQTRRRVRAA